MTIYHHPNCGCYRCCARRNRLLYWPGQRKVRKPGGGWWVIIFILAFTYDPQFPWLSLILIGLVILLIILLTISHNHRSKK